MRRLAAVLALLFFAACPNTNESGACKTTDDCAKGRTCCEGLCKDLENDSKNCGGCGSICDTPNAVNTCRVGRCQFQCQTGWGNCNDDRGDGCELDLTGDGVNCGRCGRVCMSTNAASACADGLCALGACSTGFGNCDTDSTNGCEVDTTTDSAHCGACGNRCRLPAASSHCEQSTCVVTGCDAGFGDCDGLDPNGCEVNLPTNAQHCGACNRACWAGMRCGDARCRADELIVFGGALGFTSSTVTNEVSKFDLVTKTFTVLTPAMPDGNVTPRRGHIAVWDEPRNRMIMWGGIDGAGTLSPTDTWALDFTVMPPTWRKLVTTGTPPTGRFHAAAALEASTSTWYVFGGTTDTGQGLSDLYTLELATLR
ncbi:MAG TPA: kelch repeat-containing protein, partial [Archangium sp.]